MPDFAASQPETTEQAARGDGAAILDRAVELIRTYVVLPTPEAADAIALWAAATHALPAQSFAPRLAVRSATKRAGKSRVLDMVSGLAHRPLRTVNASVPAIFRSLEDEHPRTLILDEADTIFGSDRVAENNEDLRGLLNAGFERGNPTLRCVGPQQVPTEFSSFAMAALASIGTLPDTIEDRSVVLRIHRRKPGEVHKPFRARRDRPAVEAVGQELAEWLGSEAARCCIEQADPESDLEDRQADTWEPLFAVADLAGGTWPARARRAAKVLLDEGAEDETEASLGVRLLHDIRDLFTGPYIQGAFVPTSVLLQHLKDIEGAPWSEMNLSAHRLANELRPFGITSGHNEDKSKRGYRKSDFEDAWERYPKPKDPDDHKPSGEASKASESVQGPSDLQKGTDTLTDALDTLPKASVEASQQNTRSYPVWTLSDALDGTPVGSRTAPDEDQLQAVGTNTESDNSARCDQCGNGPAQIHRSSGRRLCTDHHPRPITTPQERTA